MAGAPLLLRIDADAAIDGAGTSVAPASMLLRIEPRGEALGGVPHGPLELLALGQPEVVDRHHLNGQARRLDRRGAVLIPGLVNAHSHLDLTHIGPQPYNAALGFVGFVRAVIPRRRSDENAIAESVRKGAELSLRGGVVAVGDIGGAASGLPTLAPWRALGTTPLMGVAYLEFFALGRDEDVNLVHLERVLAEWANRRRDGSALAGVQLGMTPHAPYTVSPRAYERAASLAGGRGVPQPLPMCTHLAENPEEREFLTRASGPFRDYHVRVGNWTASLESEFGRARSPIAHLAQFLARASPLLAHVNDADDQDLAILSQSGAHVAYCPRSSEYFANQRHFGPHRYRDMLARGINVALGTDSVVNLPSGSDDPETGRISTLDEARRLFARDGADPVLLLDMATRRGARAIRMPGAAFSFESAGPKAGVVAVPVSDSADSSFRAILASDAAPELLAIGAIEAAQ